MKFIFAIFAMLIAAGCASQANPSFNISTEQAHAAVIQMRHEPKQFDRPLVVIGGFLDPNLTSGWAADFFTQISPETQIIPVCVGFCGSFEQCRAKVIDAIDKACPSSDPQWTTEVDVVGLSLGGLVARYAASPAHDASRPQRLRIARLFTVSSPLSGASLAQTISLIQFHRDMKPGSEMLESLETTDVAASYRLISYVHLHDEIVGERNAAVPGATAWWLSTPPLISPHMAAMFDERIFADIARHLRDEPPFTTNPPHPLPD